MTEKPIIIDGVDVSGCDYYVSTGECTNENTYPDYCSACSNCRYKLEQRLKAKEQSEAKLVKQIQTICDFINNRPEIFKGIYGGVDKIITEYAERKEKECEKLKK